MAISGTSCGHISTGQFFQHRFLNIVTISRFGSGMVIYWFGYVGSLDSNRSAGIMLSSEFPETFIRYKPEMVRSFKSGENTEF